MAETDPSSPPVARWRVVLRHPLTWCLALVVFGEVIRENYPFSNFPMYGEQNPQTDYYFLTDPSGQPLPTAKVTKLTSTKIKKMIAKELKPFAKTPDISLVPVEKHQEAANKILKRIVDMKGGFFAPTSRYRRPLGQPVTLNWVHISQNADSSLTRTAHELARL